MSIDEATLRNPAVLAAAPELFVCRPSFVQGMLDQRAGKQHNDSYPNVTDGMLYTHGRQLAGLIKIMNIEINDADELALAYRNALETKALV